MSSEVQTSALQSLYDEVLSAFEEAQDEAEDLILTEPDPSLKKVKKWLENATASLISWATDVRIESGSLLAVEGTLLDGEIRWNLRELQGQLGNIYEDGKFRVDGYNIEGHAIPSDPSSSEIPDVKGLAIDENPLIIMSSLIGRLQDTVRSVRMLSASRRHGGPYGDLKRRIDDIYTQHIDHEDRDESASLETRMHTASIKESSADESTPISPKFALQNDRSSTSQSAVTAPYKGATRDWAIIDVLPGTEHVRMDGAGDASQVITWQRYSGVQRSRPEVESMWTKITKDLVFKEAIEGSGYECEETEWSYYIMEYLRYEDVLRLVQISDDIRARRRERIRQIEWEAEMPWEESQSSPEPKIVTEKHRELKSSEQIRTTYHNTDPYNPWSPVAEYVSSSSVGLCFLPMMTAPLAARHEQGQLTSQEPEQRTTEWRHKTAIDLLQGSETTRIANWKPSSSFYPQTWQQSGNRRANIDSLQVKIVEDLRKGLWDLTVTLIEVDGDSLTGLILNFEHLVSGGGLDVTFDDMRMLLETMLEEARRLCLRSPRIFYMSTRCHIMQSENTHYGVDHGTFFKTLVTSERIRGILSLSASYYSLLDLNGTQDQDSMQMYIRLRFLQMVVLLLSLLNDRDLEQIAPFLESTYDICANRKDVELMLLKVLPLTSINSGAFLNAAISAFEGWGESHKGGLHTVPHTSQSFAWETFIQQIHAHRFLLPASLDLLGRENLSYIMKWPEDGFRTTECFRHLQYCGQDLHFRTMNDIERIELHPEADLAEISIILPNEGHYVVRAIDVQPISCLMSGKYTLLQPQKQGPNPELEIKERNIGVDIETAKRSLDNLAEGVDNYVKQESKSKSLSGWKALDTFQLSGQIARCEVTLGGRILAVGYKINHRKIIRSDALQYLTNDSDGIEANLRSMQQVAEGIEERYSSNNKKYSSNNKKQLRKALYDVQALLDKAKQTLQATSKEHQYPTEPIKKLLYPNSTSATGQAVWYDHDVRWRETDRILGIHGKHGQVLEVQWQPNQIAEVRMSNLETILLLQPLKPGLPGEESEQIRKGDRLTLAGRFAIVSEPVDAYEQQQQVPAHGGLEFMVTYLRIVGIGTTIASQEGPNQAQPSTQEWEKFFK